MTMFQYGTVAEGLRIQHQHDDGSWAPMEPRDPHNVAEADPERDWKRGRVYVCTTCEETIRLDEPAAAEGGDAPSGA
jgi:hypothetical protein